MFVVDNSDFKGVDFCRDLYLAFPLGPEWEEISKFFYFMLFEILCFLGYLIFFCDFFLRVYDFFFVTVNVVTHFFCTDVALVCLVGLSRHVCIVTNED